MNMRVGILVAVITCLGFMMAAWGAGLPGIPGVPVPKPPSLPKVPKLPSLPIPDVPTLLNGEDAISTSFADKSPNVPFLNDYQPLRASFLDAQPRAASGGFEVPAGSYIFHGRSYCLHAGKHVSARGAGYLWAPLKGSKAQIIQTILQRSADHLEIPQPEVQQLLWAIEARARFSDLSSQLQSDAAKLLTPAQILSLNESAIGIVPQDKLSMLMAKVPDPMKPVLEAENSLRSMLTSNQPYEEMERVAVLPPLNGPTTTLSPVRWSFVPTGLFVWFIPTPYSKTTMIVDVPGAVRVSQDASGRVTLLQDRHGNSINVSYDNSSGGMVSVPGDPQTHFYKIDSIRFAWQQSLNDKLAVQSETLRVNRWVAIGVPTGKGQPARIPGAQALYTSAQSLSAQFDSLLSSAHGGRTALAALIAVAQLQQAMEQASTSSAVHAGALAELQFPFQGWESIFASAVGGHVAADVRAGVDDPLDFWNWLGYPDNPDAQRLGQSPTPQNPCKNLPPHQGNDTQQTIASALAAGGWPGAGQDSQQIAYQQLSSGLDFEVNLNAGGGAIGPCEPGVYKIDGGVAIYHLSSNNGAQTWDTYVANVSVYNSGVFVGSGSASVGDLHTHGSYGEAIAEAMQQIHYKTK